ncbi:hypothetical protein SARC_12608, partial [Sphaeroforma arctica JP610]
TLTADNDQSFHSQDMGRYVTHTTYATPTPHTLTLSRNAKVERPPDTLNGLIRLLLIDSGMPRPGREVALLWAGDVRNPTLGENDKLRTPAQTFLQEAHPRDPKARFGCDVMFKLRGKTAKLTPKRDPQVGFGVLLGRSANSTPYCYRVQNFATQRQIDSQDIQFLTEENAQWSP